MNRKVGIAFALLLLSEHPWAQATSEFDLGVQAFSANDYSSAISHFKNAENSGNATSTLYYNLGVAYYKLEQFEKARSEFLKLENDEILAPLVNYNIGLIYARQNQDDLAIFYFQKAYEDKRDEKLRNLSARMLTKLGTPIEEKKSKTSFASLIETTVGHDTNVGLENTDLPGISGKSDDYNETAAYVSGMYNYTTNQSITTSFYVNNQKYFSLSNYDALLAVGNLNWSYNWDDVRLDVKSNLTDIRLAGSPYQSIFSLSVATQYKINNSQKIKLDYEFAQQHSKNSSYSYLDGTTQHLKATTYWKLWRPTVTAYYKLELNHLQNYSNPTTGAYRDYSPTHHIVALATETPIVSRLFLDASVDFRYSIYNKENISSTGTKELRGSKRYRGKFGGSYQFSKYWRIFSEYVYTYNDSLVNTYSYKRNQLFFGVGANF